VTARSRKLVGLVLLVAGLALYALIVMRLAVGLVPDQWLVQLIFFALAGIVWIFPAKWLIYWMQARDRW